MKQSVFLIKTTCKIESYPGSYHYLITDFSTVCVRRIDCAKKKFFAGKKPYNFFEKSPCFGSLLAIVFLRFSGIICYYNRGNPLLAKDET